MIHFQRTLVIDAASDDIWAVLSRYMHIDEFAPAITSVDALTEAAIGVGAKRRNNFENGSSVVEEVIQWNDGVGYRVQLSDMDAMPLKEASSHIYLKPESSGTKVTWTFDYRMKFGPPGWLMGVTLLKMMMGKIIDANLKGLESKVKS